MQVLVMMSWWLLCVEKGSISKSLYYLVTLDSTYSLLPSSVVLFPSYARMQWLPSGICQVFPSSHHLPSSSHLLHLFPLFMFFYYTVVCCDGLLSLVSEVNERSLKWYACDFRVVLICGYHVQAPTNNFCFGHCLHSFLCCV